MINFNFDNTYLSLPEKFYSLVNPTKVNTPQLAILNENLLNSLDLSFDEKEEISEYLSGNKIPEGASPLAQAYAGHQFGHFTMLGDGRAILLGEHLTKNNLRFDIQLKGSGATPYSRRGDGRATFSSMLREYLFSEALYQLCIPTSRSLAVVKTSEKVYRENISEGAVLTRVMKSHLRVGTFEFARYYGSADDYEALLNYTINRLYPEIAEDENKALSFLETVLTKQTNLVANWMRVGFIHGVMNTDNTSISAETFDFGPCAFMNTYHPETVFSSIDTQGRYAYGNQPKIIKWNIVKLAETLIPSIHTNQEKAIELATVVINKFDTIFANQWRKTMFDKIGIVNPEADDKQMVIDLLNIMKTEKLDFTNTFTFLRLDLDHIDSNILNSEKLAVWKENWLGKIENRAGGKQAAFELMKQNNPVFILRNIFVESALDNAERGDFSEFNLLLKALENPYEYSNEYKHLMKVDPEFDEAYQTFCGT